MENKKDYKIIVVPILISLVFIFSLIGFREVCGKEFSIPGVIYATLSFFTLENTKPEEATNNLYLLIARYIAAAMLGFGVYTLLYNYISRQIIRLKIKYRFHRHVIVFSSKLVGANFIQDLIAHKYKVILIDEQSENPVFEKLEKEGLIIFKEKDYNTRLFDTIFVNHASSCVVALDDDSQNIELTLNLIKYLGYKECKHTVKILTHIEESNNLEVIKDYIDVSNAEAKFDLEIFNIHSSAAKKIYDHFPPHEYFDFDAPDVNSIAVIGYNQVAEDFLLENVILSHYKDCKNIKVYIVDKEADLYLNSFLYKYPFSSEFADLIPIKLLNNKFFANFSISKELIEKLSKVKVVYFFGDKGSELMNMAARFRQFLSGQINNYIQVPIVVCYPEDISMMKLLDVEKDVEQEMITDVKVDKTKATVGRLSKIFKHQLNIHFVNMITDTCTSNRLLEESEYIDLLSRVINYYYSILYEFEWTLKEKLHKADAGILITEIEKKWQDLSDKHTALTEHEIELMVLQSVANFTKKSVDELRPLFGIKKWWDQLSYHKKSSNRYAARHLAVKIRIMKSINCFPLTRENIVNSFGVLAPIEHKRWSAEKMALNYRYGVLPKDKKAKNIAKEILKIHDQLIPYEKLDDQNKEKDLNIFLLMPLLSSLKVDSKK